MSDTMYAREFKSQMRESLDKFVADVEDDARDKGPRKTADEWFSTFAEFLTEHTDGEKGEPASVVDLFDMLAGSDDDSEEEE